MDVEDNDAVLIIYSASRQTSGTLTAYMSSLMPPQKPSLKPLNAGTVTESILIREQGVLLVSPRNFFAQQSSVSVSHQMMEAICEDVVW
jgi:hypothetical protein